MPVVAVVTGPSGAGKSTAGPLLARRPPPERCRVCDLDDAGVVDRAGPARRRDRVGALARAAEEHAGAGAGRATVLVGVIERGDLPEPMPLPVRFCLLDAADETLRERLFNPMDAPGARADLQRVVGLTLERFVEADLRYAQRLRDAFAADNVVDTTHLSREEVADRLTSWIAA